MVTLVLTEISGSVVTGGGLCTLAFEDPVDDTACETLLTTVGSFWTGMASAVTTVTTFTVLPNPSRYAAADGSLQEVFTADAPAAVTGTASGDSVAKSSMVLIRWVTADIVDNRVVKGRTYIPGALSTMITSNGGVESALRTDVLNAAEALIAGTGGTLSVWHRPKSNGASPPVYSGGSSHLVTSASVWDQFAVLRSRRD